MAQLMKTVKSGLNLAGNVLMTVGHIQNKQGAYASSSATSATSALIQFYEDFMELVNPQQSENSYV